MKVLDTPRVMSSHETFETLVQWFHDEIIIERKAPGFIVGLSGTDSLVVFCAASKAFEKAGKPERVMGVHFAPSEDFLYDHPEAETHLWFQNEVLPWLNKYAPNSKVVVDTSIDWRCDGLRWGYLMDLSVVSNIKKRVMRLPDEQYWVVGTRNRTEDILMNYSNASTAVSIQPIVHLWKSEILQISKYLGIPQIAINKSCETDCICGRMQAASQNIKELDLLLMAQQGELSGDFIKNNISVELQNYLNNFIRSQLSKNEFKRQIPYFPDKLLVATIDSLVSKFEDGSLDSHKFNHKKHLYIAWYYLKRYSFDESVHRYMHCLQTMLTFSGELFRLSEDITRAYFAKIDQAMKLHHTDTFDDLIVKCPEILSKI